MTREEAINILQNEIQCVLRDSCERSECASCDLVMPIEQILSAYDMAIDALQEQEERQWIPVTERLPEEGDYALCVLKGFNYGGKIQVCKFVPADKFKDKPYFEHFRNGFPSVTHWMPLPHPPKGE